MQSMRDPAAVWQQRTPSMEAQKKRSNSSGMVAIFMSLKVRPLNGGAEQRVDDRRSSRCTRSSAVAQKLRDSCVQDGARTGQVRAV